MLRLLKPNEEAMLRMILHALNQFPLEWGCVHRSREPMMDSFPPQPKDCDVCVRAIFLGATKRIILSTRARGQNFGLPLPARAAQRYEKFYIYLTASVTRYDICYTYLTADVTALRFG